MSRSKKPPPPPGGERRMFERLDFVAQVELSDNDHVVLLRAHDISAGGLGVEISEGEAPELVRGAVVAVYIDIGQMHEGLPLVLRAAATVQHRREPSAGRAGGVGLSWDANDEKIRASVRRISQALKLH